LGRTYYRKGPCDWDQGREARDGGLHTQRVKYPKGRTWGVRGDRKLKYTSDCRLERLAEKCQKVTDRRKGKSSMWERLYVLREEANRKSYGTMSSRRILKAWGKRRGALSGEKNTRFRLCIR